MASSFDTSKTNDAAGGKFFFYRIESLRQKLGQVLQESALGSITAVAVGKTLRFADLVYRWPLPEHALWGLQLSHPSPRDFWQCPPNPDATWLDLLL